MEQIGRVIKQLKTITHFMPESMINQNKHFFFPNFLIDFPFVLQMICFIK